MLLPVFSLSLMQRNSRVERVIYGPSLCRHEAIAAASPPVATARGGSGLLCRRSDARWLAEVGREKRWVAPRGPVHNLGHLCIHIHLYEWARGKCKPKVIAPDKNICLVNKYSNEASVQVPLTDAGLTGLRRDRR